jgi:nucleoside-diphosphate-sugar epimerase
MRLLITGADGFTGIHLAVAAKLSGYEVFALQGNLQDAKSICQQVLDIAPTHVIHLAGISHATLDDELAYYEVNLLGSLNLLEALTKLAIQPEKIILASTSHVYGNNIHSPIREKELPAPISHYAMSKLAMEYMSRPFLNRLPIIFTRPFNYTGIGHAEHFVIPKIVNHFQRKAEVIELGNLDVLREYNDVRDVCEVYISLLSCGKAGEIYNIASGRSYSLHEVINALVKISGFTPQISTNPKFLRNNEIFDLKGDVSKLGECINDLRWRPLDLTLEWMYQG